MNSRPLTVLSAAVAGVMALAVGPAGAQVIAPPPPQGAVPPATPLPPADAADWRTVSPDNLLVIDTTKGRILVELEPRVAPQSVERIRTLTNRGFYDGLKFHRVIRGFMAQTGDPLGTGAGSSDLPDVPGEFSFRRGRNPDFAIVPNASTSGVRGILGSLPIQTQPDAQMFVTADMKVDAGGLFCPGVAGMARSADPNSANSQFYLMTGANPNLNGTYTTFGRVVSGLDVVKALNAGADASDGAVANPDVMTKAQLASAMPEAQRPVVKVLLPTSPAFAQRYEATRNRLGLNFGICDVETPSIVTGG
ncbi:peptidylprolyl isomerase [Brevundimonas goettingensis]|nr:peptidylprolyl isomerase [Brevundimonas goettingensis]